MLLLPCVSAAHRRAHSPRSRRDRSGSIGRALGPPQQIGELRRERAGAARWPFPPPRGISPDALWRAPPSGPSARAAPARAAATRDGAVRIEQLAGLAQGFRNRRAGSPSSSMRRAVEERARPLPLRVARRQCAGSAKGRHRRGNRFAVSLLQLEQQALEIARHLDIHARAEARFDAADGHGAVVDEAREDVIAVGGDDELGDGQAEAARRMRSIDIAEIAGGHG